MAAVSTLWLARTRDALTRASALSDTRTGRIFHKTRSRPLRSSFLSIEKPQPPRRCRELFVCGREQLGQASRSGPSSSVTQKHLERLGAGIPVEALAVVRQWAARVCPLDGCPL
ncbi:hypothetical protein HPB50_004544 [Hyalomma asiaticum]|uniref:Uncharacterized protein n=1 Tax=Hyalomma asiaticum TaxID=266040 RepID=A0ACB7RXZ7_HYAAI|nr:hypothetical protein HPB50_004544 [Hyalomma asiaticum]